MFGSRYEYDHEFFQAMIKMMADNSKIANGPWGMVKRFRLTSHNLFYRLVLQLNQSNTARFVYPEG